MRLQNSLYILAPIILCSCIIVPASIRYRQNTEDWEQSSQTPVVATVIDNPYKDSLPPLEKPEGEAGCSNYPLKLKTDEGKLVGLSVISGGNFKKEALTQLIEDCSRISFPPSNFIRKPTFFSYNKVYGETVFTSESQIATKRADRIKVLD